MTGLACSVTLSLFLVVCLVSQVIHGDCTYSDGTHYFDLSPLSQDWTVVNPSDMYFQFLLNPCAPLVSLPANTICPVGSSLVCQVSRIDNSPYYLAAQNFTLSYDQNTTGTYVLFP